MAALLDDPATVQARLGDVLAAVRDAFFDHEGDGLRASLHQAVLAARAVLSTQGTITLLAELAHGMHRVDDRTVSIDKSWDATVEVTADRHLLLVPSLLCHPHVVVQPNPEWPWAIQYPVHRRAPAGG